MGLNMIQHDLMDVLNRLVELALFGIVFMELDKGLVFSEVVHVFSFGKVVYGLIQYFSFSK